MLRFELATMTDDARLRQLLRENPMSGTITLSFEREPSYFAAAALEGPFQQTLVARRDDGEVVALSSRTVRDLYVNGRPRSVGYMSILRFDQRLAWGMSLPRSLSKGFAAYHELHRDGRAPFYLLSIVADNQPAQRLLNAQLPHFPQLQPYITMHTYALAVGRRRKVALPLAAGLTLRRAGPDDRCAILACLQRNGQRCQFVPVWTAENLWGSAQTPGLSPQDFWVVADDTKILGCLARWDQSQVKQTVVRGYGKRLARWRRSINWGASLLGWPPLPPVNTLLHHTYASHLAVDDDDPMLFAALLRAVYNDAIAHDDHYLMLGLAAEHEWGRVVSRQYRHLTYRSQLYLAYWPDGADAVHAVDRRPPGLEIALL